MLQGVCVDPGQTAVLEKGRSYFLFPKVLITIMFQTFQNKIHIKAVSKPYIFKLLRKSYGRRSLRLRA